MFSGALGLTASSGVGLTGHHALLQSSRFMDWSVGYACEAVETVLESAWMRMEASHWQGALNVVLREVACSMVLNPSLTHSSNTSQGAFVRQNPAESSP